MRSLLLATTALVLAAPAYAADMATKMPVKAPPMPAAAPFSWTACYLGGHVGAGWGRAKIGDPTNFVGSGTGFFAPTGASVDVDQGAGALGGAQLGCDYQFANNWVIGAAGDFSFADISGVEQDPYFAGKGGRPITLSQRTDWLATVTGRVGYAFDRWLVYGKGGAAWARNRYTIRNLVDWGTPGNFCATGAVGFADCNPTGAATTAGWTAGFGVSYALSGNWSAGIEYDHYGFGSATKLLTDPNVVTFNPAAPVVVSQQIDVVKFTLDYRFAASPYR